MNEATRSFVDLGLAWVVDRLPERVRNARLRHGTNDIVLIIFPQGDNQTADVFSGTRQQLIEDLLAADPPLPVTLARIAEPCPVGEVWAVVYMADGVYSMSVASPANTTGVLN